MTAKMVDYILSNNTHIIIGILAAVLHFGIVRTRLPSREFSAVFPRQSLKLWFFRLVFHALYNRIRVVCITLALGLCVSFWHCATEQPLAVPLPSRLDGLAIDGTQPKRSQVA